MSRFISSHHLFSSTHKNSRSGVGLHAQEVHPAAMRFIPHKLQMIAIINIYTLQVAVDTKSEDSYESMSEGRLTAQIVSLASSILSSLSK